MSNSNAIASMLTRPLATRVNGLPEPVDFQSGLIPPSDTVLLAAAEALDAGKTHYTDRPGILPLREKIAASLGMLGVHINADAITITCGVTEARFVALRTWLEGEKSLYTTEAETLAGVIGLIGASFTKALESASVVYEKSPELLSSAVATLPEDFTPWLVWEMSANATPETVAPLVASLQRRDRFSRLLVIGEFRDIPGWRVGFMAGSSAHGKLRSFKQSMTICSPSISQWAAMGTNLTGESR